LSPAQVTKLDEALKANVFWSPTTTCAGWASDTVSAVTGKKLDASEFLSIETPRKLAETLHKLEARNPTAPDRPHAPIPQQATSNSFGDDPAVDKPGTQRPAAPHAAVADPLYRQAQDAVRRLDEGMGRSFDHHSACMAASTACMAKANGFERIDHVVLSNATGTLRAGENVFVVQGALSDATNRIAFMKTQDALATPTEHSLERMAAMNRAQAVEAVQHEAQVQTRQAAHRMTV